LSRTFQPSFLEWVLNYLRLELPPNVCIFNSVSPGFHTIALMNLALKLWCVNCMEVCIMFARKLFSWATDIHKKQNLPHLSLYQVSFQCSDLICAYPQCLSFLF
jgi:hypothetical protein